MDKTKVSPSFMQSHILHKKKKDTWPKLLNKYAFKYFKYCFQKTHAMLMTVL